MLACIAPAQWPRMLATESAINSSSWLWMDFSRRFTCSDGTRSFWLHLRKSCKTHEHCCWKLQW